MTVSSTTTKASYSGNGSTTVFAVPFYFLQNADLLVILRSSAGVETTQVLGTNYTLTGAGNENGGSLTMTVAPPTGTTLTILRNAAATQETDLLPNDRLPAESLETALDKLTMLVQQLDEESARSIKFAATDTSTSATLPTSSQRANKFLSFDSSGNPIVTGATDIYTVGVETKIATQGQTVFTLSTISYTPGINNLSVFVDGVNQVGGSAYTETSSTSVTFSQGLHAGAVVKFSTVRTLTSGSADSASVTFLPAGSSAIQSNVQVKLRESVSVKDFGAVGDGVTNDTSAIQAALNSGAKVVYAVQNCTYLVYNSGSFSVNGTQNRYCLTIPDGVTFDLQGSMIRQAGGQNSSVIAINATTDSAITNGVIDSNKSGQTTPATGDLASVIVHNASRPRVEKIRAINNRQYAGRFLKITDGKFFDLHCTDSDGDGWAFGIDGGWGAHLVRCLIDKIYAENCTQVYAGMQGNGAIFTTRQCNVGNVLTRNCGGGIKIQDSAEDSAFDSLIFIGQTNGSTNSGIKIQGNVGVGLYPKRIQIANAVSVNSYGNGLFINEVDSVEIGSYSGITNGTGVASSGSNQYDVDCKVRANGRVLIGRIDVDSPGTIGARLFGSGSVSINSISVKSPSGSGVSVSGDSSFEFFIDNLRVIDTGTMTYAFVVTGANKGSVGTIVTNAANSLSQARVVVSDAIYNVKINRIFLGSTDTVEGVVQLTNGATSTSVACGHIYRVYIGGASSYFQPIIQLVPWNATAAALGNMRATVTDSSSGTGFTINHASAGASDYVFYKVLGWQAMTRNSA